MKKKISTTKDIINSLDAIKDSKNFKLLHEFSIFCYKHPELRFYQSLRGWMGVNFLLTSTHFDAQMFDRQWMNNTKAEVTDTFYFEDKLK